MEKKKVSLEELKVDSFITTVDNPDELNDQGGSGPCTYVASFTAVTILSYNVTKGESWWHCGDPCYCPG